MHVFSNSSSSGVLGLASGIKYVKPANKMLNIRPALLNPPFSTSLSVQNCPSSQKKRLNPDSASLDKSADPLGFAAPKIGNSSEIEKA